MKKIIVFILALTMIFSASSVSFAADNYTEYFSEEREFVVSENILDPSTYLYSNEITGYLYSYNIDTNEEKLIYPKSVTTHYIWDGYIYCIIDGKSIVKITVTGQNPQTILVSDEDIEQLYVNDDLIFYLSNNSIYRYHIESKTTDLMISDTKISFFYPYSNITIEYEDGGENPTIKMINGKQRSTALLNQYTYIKNIEQRATVVNSAIVHGKNIPYGNYSNGKYYNNSNNNNSPCSCHTDSTKPYKCSVGYNCDMCIVIEDGTNNSAMQCHALGCQTYKNIWQSYVNYNGSSRLINNSVRAKSEFQKIPSGSMVRVHTSSTSGANHTIIVADVTSTGATIYEANFSGYCIVSMKHFTFSELSSRYYKIEWSYEGNHTFGSNYGYDTSYHWNKCTHSQCNAKYNFKPHVFAAYGNGTEKCTSCSYIRSTTVNNIENSFEQK